MTKIEVFNGLSVKFQIWDTYGAERFQSILRAYYRNSSGFFLVYDITQKKSFEAILHWKNCCDEATETRHQFILLGNKSDLGNGKEREVTTEEGEIWATEHGMPFFEVSALTGDNVFRAARLLFESIIRVEIQWTICSKEESNKALVFNSIFTSSGRS